MRLINFLAQEAKAAILKLVGVADKKEEKEGTEMAVKLTKECDELRAAVDRWNYVRIKNLRAEGYGAQEIATAMAESNRYQQMVEAAVETLGLGETKKEYWLLFLDDITTSPYLCFITRKTASDAEISRHFLHAEI